MATSPTNGTSPIQAESIVRLLGIPEDVNWLSETLVLIRSCLEVFTATPKDVHKRSKKGGSTLPVKSGRVGIRCKYCSRMDPNHCHKGAVSYPAKIRIINQSVRNWQRYHFLSCKHVPPEIHEKYRSLKSVRSHSGHASILYWIKSAKSIGLVDTEKGIYFGNKPRPFCEFLESNLQSDDQNEKELMVTETNTGEVTDVMLILLSQQQICDENDENKTQCHIEEYTRRRGVECRHCASLKSNSFRCFPESSDELGALCGPYSIFHSHLMACMNSPEEVKKNITNALSRHKIQSENLPDGWKKDFFNKLWLRLDMKRIISTSPRKDNEGKEEPVDAIDVVTADTTKPVKRTHSVSSEESLPMKKRTYNFAQED